MAKPINDPIADALNLDPVVEIMPAARNITPLLSIESDQKLELDFQYARENLYGVIEQGTKALEGIVDLAAQSQQPRTYEVVADLIRTLAGANKDLLDLQKKVHDMKVKEDGPTKITNNLFVGSTKDLTSLLKGHARDVL
jgi:hypothetical protein